MEKTLIIEDKYEVISKIKQGGFGIVYYGFDRKFEKPVAIKAIEPSLLQEAKYIDMFLGEAKNAAKLNHNNIVHVYDLIKTNDGQYYIIMEYIDGVDLQRILRKCRSKEIKIPLKLSIYIIKEVCKALEYAHNKRDLISNEPLNLVHQDISPSNIMVSINGNVKLIDFGIAGIKFNRNGESNSIVMSGKLPYMAPEQLNGSKIDRRSDLFSLGSVFYEALTNEMLFNNESDEKIIEEIKKGRLNQRLLDESGIPETIQKILVKSLQRNIDDRYQGANGIYIDLVEYLMTSVESVELSNELGEFIRDIFSDNDDKQLIVEDHKDVVQSDKSSESVNDFENSDVLTFSETVMETENDHEDEIATTKEKLDYSENKMINFDITERSEKLIEELSLRDDSDDEFEIDDSFEDEKHGLDEREDDVAEFNEEFKNEIQSIPNYENEEVEKIDSKVIENDIEIAQLEAELKDELQLNNDSVLANEDVVMKNTKTTAIKGEIVEGQSIAQFKPSIASKYSDDEAGEDEIKTVIDVIRLSAKTYQKPITIGAIGAGVSLLLFMVLNIIFGWTSSGRKIYDFLFPPAIRIYSAPQGATVYIDDEEVPGKTPLSVSKVAPGVHKLTLAYAGYPVLTRSLQVPSKGDLQVAGEQSRKGYEPYLFRFKTQFEIDSHPPGATVYVNNIKYNQKTPTTLEWEVGVPLNIDMNKSGFQELTGFSFNTLDETVEIEDRRLWEFTTVDGESKKYIINGLFKKFVQISSLPSDAVFYLDGSPTPTGKTGSAQSIALSVGNHDLLFTKEGYISRRISITVDEMGPNSIFAMLSRNVRIFAKDETDPTDNDIAATIIRIYRDDKSYHRDVATPCELQLPPVDHRILVRKQGYKDAMVTISPNQRVVVVRMEPESIKIDVLITDALSGLALENAQISYVGLNGETEGEVVFGVTNENGECSKDLIPGQYTFKVIKPKYFEKSSNINTADGNTKLNFKLIIQ